MKKSFLVILILFPALMFAQTLNQKEFDEKRNNEMLIGYCNRDGFKMIRSSFDSIFQAEYAAYKPDQATIDLMKNKFKKIKITVVMGTWCSDSKDWIPRFYKVMDLAGFDYDKLTLICVDHVKNAPVKDLKKLKIDKIPTFIIYRKRHEKGRIIETPTGLLEKDILGILSK
jgi:hypothetical protein